MGGIMPGEKDPLSWPGSLKLDDLSPEKRLEIDGIRRAEDDIAGGFIRLGGHLCRLKELCEHGEFEALAAMYCRLGARHRRRAMQVFQEFGQNGLASPFSANALIELTRADDPQAALAEANERKEAGEEVTAKVAREIAAAQKAQREAEERAESAEAERAAIQLRLDEAVRQTQPDQSRLIRELALRRKGGGISDAEAQAYSVLPEYLQRAILETLRKSDAAAVDRQKAERTAAEAVAAQQEAMERAASARVEADEAKRRADELAREGAQAVIDDLNAQIDTLNKRIERERETAWEGGKKAGAAETLKERDERAAELAAKVAALEREKASVQRKLSSAEGTMESMRQERRMLEARARGAEEQLEAAHPLAKDNIHAQVIAHMTEDLKATLAKLEADCEPHQRKFSEQALSKLADLVNGYLDKASVILIEGESV